MYRLHRKIKICHIYYDDSPHIGTRTNPITILAVIKMLHEPVKKDIYVEISIA